MQGRPIRVDETLQELTPHGTNTFPVSMDEQHVTDVGCCNIAHWHYEIQIVRMIEGEALFCTPGHEFCLHAGEGIFLNSGVLHEVRRSGESNGVYICVNFSPSILSADANSTIYRDYVAPLTGSESMQAFALRGESWHQEILALLPELAAINDRQEYGYELEMKILLCRIWHLIVVNNRNYAEKAAVVSFADKQRARILTNFIQQNYRRRLTLADIAAAGHVSAGECCRIFQRTGLPSPIVYLKQTRVAQSAKLLTCTNLDVMEIAFQSGFESSSYYAKCFKKEMNCTPGEYRQTHRKNYTIADELASAHLRE